MYNGWVKALSKNEEGTELCLVVLSIQLDTIKVIKYYVVDGCQAILEFCRSLYLMPTV